MTQFNRKDRVQQAAISRPMLPSGSAFHPADSPFRSKRQRPSFYADPVSWLALEAFEQALSHCSEDLTQWPEHIGLITLSDTCTLQTMREIEAKLAEGLISPLKFSGANPGAIGSLPSHFFGFSGPTLVLSMPPEEGLDLATMLAEEWLREGNAKFVVITRHWMTTDGHRVESTIFSNAEEAGQWRE